MAKQTESNREIQARVPLTLFLMGALAFSLSSLPHQKNTETFTVTNLSSEFASTCADMVNSIDSGANDGTCSIRPTTHDTDLANVEGVVDVKMTNLNHRDPNDFNKIVTSQQWEYTVKVLCDGKNCPDGIGSTLTTTGHVNKEDYKSITAKVLADFHSEATQMADRIKDAKAAALKERQRLAKIEKCEIDEDGEKIEGKAQMSCRVGKLDGMDEDKAADYYEKNILPDLEHLVGSSNVRDQKQGAVLLQQLKASGAGGDFVHDSIGDLSKFGSYNLQANNLKGQLLTMDPRDPQYQTVKNTMVAAKFQADTFFHNRSTQVGQEDWTLGDKGVDFSGLMLNNLADYQFQIDQNYNAILNQYRTTMQNGAAYQPPFNGQQQQPTQVYPDGRTQRAPLPPPSSPFPAGAQFGQQQPATLSAASTSLPVPTTALSKFSTSAASGIPRAGTPVR